MKNKEKYDLEKIKICFYNRVNGSHEFVVLYHEQTIATFIYNGLHSALIKLLNWLESEYKEPIKLSEDEKAILRSLPKEYKWIARNGGDWLCVYTNKPTKCDIMWNSCDGYRYWIDIFNHLFQFIKCSDVEPWSIEELLKDEC